MKILIDLTNTPHVLFFRPIIAELKKKGYKIDITAREHAQTIGMLDFFKLNYKIIGKHAGKSKIKKALTLFSRVLELKRYIKKINPNLCLCHQSPYLVLAAFLSGKKSIYIFDNETARLQNLLAVPFASKVLCPEAIKQKKFYGKKLIKYPGIKEAVYLAEFKPKKDVIKQLKLKKNKKIIVMRAEPSTAAYYNEKENVLVRVINEIVNEKSIQIVFIPRNELQREKYKKLFNGKIIIPDKVVDGPSLLYHSNLLIGAGGTMNREAVVLGTPVISTYQEKLLAVDKSLKNVIYNKNPSLSLIKNKLFNKKFNQKGKRKKISLEKGKQAIKKIIREIEN